MRDSDRLLIRTACHRRGLVVLLAILQICEVSAGILLPATLAAAIDVVVGRSGSTTPIVLIGVLLGLITAAEIGGQIVEARVKAAATARLRHAVFARVFSLGVPGTRRFSTGDVLNRALESSAEAGAAGPNLLDMVFSPLISLGGLIALAVIDWRLILVFAVGVPAVTVLAAMLIRRTTALTARYQEAHGDLSHRFIEAVGGARTIRAAGSLDREVARVLLPLARLHQAGIEFWETQRHSGWYLSLLAPVLQIGVLITAGTGVVAGRLSAGELVAAQLYLTYAMRLLSQVGILASLGRVRGSTERVQEIFDEPLPPAGIRPLPAGPGVLLLRGITALADDKVVLEGLDLEVPAGARLAVVGVSGAGKTTMALIAGGVLSPQSGEVRLDGVDLATVDPAAVRGAIAFAFERPHLLGETVAGMIGYGDRPISMDAVRRAAHASHADRFIARLPAGYDTALSTLRLSGGEVQRLGLARALCRDARVVVLDDAMSSVDTATENDIVAAMDDTLRGTTRIVVAHRMLTAETADLVAWLDGGRIRAFGPHRELLADPAYREVFGAQLTSVSS